VDPQFMQRWQAPDRTMIDPQSGQNGASTSVWKPGGGIESMNPAGIGGMLETA